MWWTLAWINDDEGVLCLWQDLGREDPYTGEDHNPGIEVPFLTDVDDMRRLRAQHEESHDVECYVPEDMKIVTQWRVER